MSQPPPVVPVVVTRTVQSRKHHGGFWWLFVGWWWWLIIGWWWKPIKGLVFSGPRAAGRAAMNHHRMSQAESAISRGMTQQPAPPPVTAAAPGWYPDPWEPGRTRWFDGQQWTAQQQP